MSKELNLSEKILEKDNRYYLDIAWIKEFIKEIIKMLEEEELTYFEILGIVKHLAGDKLREDLI